jgi:hypothetical protein
LANIFSCVGCLLCWLFSLLWKTHFSIFAFISYAFGII